MPPTRRQPDPDGWETPTRARRGGTVAVATLVGAVVAIVALATAGGDGGTDLTVEPTPPAPAPDATPDGEPDAAPGPTPAWARIGDTAGTWVALPEAPIGPRTDPVVVWTGAGQGYAPRARGELLVWGGRRGLEGLAGGAAYNPVLGEWRRITNAPFAWGRDSTHLATWTGQELVTVAAGDNGQGSAWLAYDPARDRWRETAPPPPGVALWQAAGWSGDEVVVLTSGRQGSPRAVAYHPAADVWRHLPRPPVQDDRGTLLAAHVPGGLAVVGQARGRPALTLLPTGEAWTEPDPLPTTTSSVTRPLLDVPAVDPEEGRVLLMGVAADDHRVRKGWAWSEPEGWQSLPDLHLESVSRRARLAWGGGRLHAWLGDGAAAGAVLEPAGGWRPMAPPPLSPRHGAGAAWTGRALVVWGGIRHGQELDDGAAFLPWAGISDGRLRTGR